MNVSRVLVVRTDRMGDVILSTPVLTALKAMSPPSQTAMLVRPYTREIVDHHPDLDRVMVDDREGRHRGIRGLLTLAREIRCMRFDAALLLHSTFRLALICLAAGIPRRIGTAYRFYSPLFSQRVRIHRRGSERHECDLNLDLAAAAGVPAARAQFRIDIPEPAHCRVRQLLADAGVAAGAPFITLHPGSGGSARDWPAARFAVLGERIATRLKWPVLITGTASEKSLIDGLADLCPSLIRLDGQLSMIELAALLQRTAVLVANSTGPLHLAVALGTEVIGLYPPMSPMWAKRWGPYRRPDSVITPPLKEALRAPETCMDLISLEQVWERLQRVLGRTAYENGKAR